MHDIALVSRRALAALPIAVLVGASVAAPVADCASARIDAAAARCLATRKALADVLEAYEKALPAPHPSLDMTNLRSAPYRWAMERRLCDGGMPHRAIDCRGDASPRHVATVDTIGQDIDRIGDPDLRRPLYRMRRRAVARAAQVAKLEASFRLDELQIEVNMANRALEDLTRELFAAPASSMATVLVQAKALSVYAETIRADHAGWQTGRYGKQLAAGLQSVARAA